MDDVIYNLLTEAPTSKVGLERNVHAALRACAIDDKQPSQALLLTLLSARAIMHVWYVPSLYTAAVHILIKLLQVPL